MTKTAPPKKPRGRPRKRKPPIEQPRVPRMMRVPRGNKGRFEFGSLATWSMDVRPFVLQCPECGKWMMQRVVPIALPPAEACYRQRPSPLFDTYGNAPTFAAWYWWCGGCGHAEAGSVEPDATEEGVYRAFWEAVQEVEGGGK